MLGSASVYPSQSVQPIKEEYLLTGKLEPVNESYGMAKIIGIKQCQAYNKQYGTKYINVNPCNVYGPRDNFNPSSSHVVAALIRKFYEAKISGKKQVECWGTGSARRELIYVEDQVNFHKNKFYHFYYHLHTQIHFLPMIFDLRNPFLKHHLFSYIEYCNSNCMSHIYTYCIHNKTAYAQHTP